MIIKELVAEMDTAMIYGLKKVKDIVCGVGCMKALNLLQML